MAPSKDLAELDEKNKGRFKKLIDETIAKGRNEEWANTEGYGVGSGVTGYVRYFAIGDVSMWFGYDLRMWGQYGGPLWVGFQERAQNNIGIVREGLRELCVKRPEDFYHDVPSWSRRRDYIRINLPCSSEYQELLKSLLEQLREIAEALKKSRTARLIQAHEHLSTETGGVRFKSRIVAAIYGNLLPARRTNPSRTRQGS